MVPRIITESGKLRRAPVTPQIPIGLRFKLGKRSHAEVVGLLRDGSVMARVSEKHPSKPSKKQLEIAAASARKSAQVVQRVQALYRLAEQRRQADGFWSGFSPQEHDELRQLHAEQDAALYDARLPAPQTVRLTRLVKLNPALVKVVSSETAKVFRLVPAIQRRQQRLLSLVEQYQNSSMNPKRILRLLRSRGVNVPNLRAAKRRARNIQNRRRK